MTKPCSIIVDVKSEYSSEYSEPENKRFVFVYHINIRNIGDRAAQLISRHWVITDGNGTVEEVMGDGVIGKQPVIAAGAAHQYQSYCELKTNVGYMQGSYQMLSEDGESFDAPVAAFTLAAPGALN